VLFTAEIAEGGKRVGLLINFRVRVLKNGLKRDRE
jgi:hypothetical protein